MFFSRIIFTSLLFLLFTASAHGASVEQFQILSKWFQEHYNLSAENSIIPSYDCDINVSLTRSYFSISIKKRNIESTMRVSVDSKPYQYNDPQDKLSVTMAYDELIAELEATSCETQGCTDILYPKFSILANDHYVELRNFDAFPKATRVGCSLKNHWQN